ncbi:hypothetical protein EGM51_04165 [Verrucomicrobia bacterium S94]|nr:hypothetical protein EGM51_04165 [Verrucomicrobia bacterium S94]
MKSILLFALLTISLPAFPAERPNLLFIMLDDLGVGHCQFYNDDLTVDQFDLYFKERVARTQEYTPEQALEFSKKAMPTLTKLARSGAFFSHAYAASSLCARPVWPLPPEKSHRMPVCIPIWMSKAAELNRVNTLPIYCTKPVMPLHISESGM